MKKIETITPNEIAAILRIHPFTVTRLAREGKLPGFKVGGIWRFRRDQFEEWINAQSKAGKNRSKKVRRATVRA